MVHPIANPKKIWYFFGMKKTRAHLVIHGLVQGVFFRSETAGEARAKGLTGEVWNNPDGTVEAVIEGPDPEVRELVEWCHHGPPSARVDNVDITWEEPVGAFTDFSVTFPSSW